MSFIPTYGLRIKIVANGFIGHDLKATLVDINLIDKQLLAKFDQPIRVLGVVCTHAILSPKKAVKKDSYLAPDALSCTVIGIPESRFNSDAPFDLTWWRGGMATTTDIIVLEC